MLYVHFILQVFLYIYPITYNKQLLFDILYNSFNSYNFSNNNIILCGDFNINFMDISYRL